MWVWSQVVQDAEGDGVRAGERFDDLARRYAEPTRFYHTLDHVMDVLATVENLAAQARNQDAVKLAAWLHDVIYDSKASDNEERSADHAERLCETGSIRPACRSWTLLPK